MTQEEKQFLSELIKKLVKGDKTAYDIIYKRFYSVFFCFIKKYINDEQTIEDITQETFLELLKPGFRIPFFTNPSAYLFQIAKNKSLDYLRRKDTCDNYIKGLITAYLSAEQKDAEHATLEKINANELFAGMDEWEFRLMLLRYSSGYKVFEIAERIGVSERTLNRKFKEIKRTLDQRLRERIS